MIQNKNLTFAIANVEQNHNFDTTKMKSTCFL